MIGSVMRHSYSITNFCTHSDLRGTTGHFEIWRLCGLISKPETWVNHLEIICEEERLNGCGRARSAPKNTLELEGGWDDIDVENAEWYWSM